MRPLEALSIAIVVTLVFAALCGHAWGLWTGDQPNEYSSHVGFLP
jgi:hypothetical protein